MNLPVVLIEKRSRLIYVVLLIYSLVHFKESNVCDKQIIYVDGTYLCVTHMVCVCVCLCLMTIRRVRRRPELENMCVCVFEGRKTQPLIHSASI